MHACRENGVRTPFIIRAPGVKPGPSPRALTAVNWAGVPPVACVYVYVYGYLYVYVYVYASLG
jgi:hypothetical protein